MTFELPLPLVLGMVAVGVPAVVLLTHLTGGSAARPLDERAITKLILQEDPERTVTSVQLADDRLSALARTDDGTVWVAWAMESLHAVRSVPPDGLTPRPDGLLCRLSDPGWPARTVKLADPEQRSAWADPAPEGTHGAA